MKNVILGLLLIVSFLLTSCGSGDCVPGDFIATWTLQSDAQCSTNANTTVTVDNSLVITAGSTTTTVMNSGIDLEVDGCTASLSGAFELQLDGDILTANISGCSFEYSR